MTPLSFPARWNRTIIIAIGMLFAAGSVSGVVKPKPVTQSQTRTETPDEIAPLKVKPDAVTYRDFQRTQLKWAQRVLGAPFRARLHGSPTDAAATAFVEHALAEWSLEHGRNMDTGLAAEGAAVLDAGCDDPLVQYLAGVFFAVESSDWRRARDCYAKAMHPPDDTHPYPAVLRWLAAMDFVAVQEAHLRDYKEALPQLVEATRQMLTDGSYTADDDAMLVHHQTTEYGDDVSQKLAPQLVAIFREAKISEWARHTLLGWLENALAWEDRGGTYAGGVTPEGWKGFGKHLAAARRELLAAWKLRADRPEPAWLMMRVTMAEATGDETPRLWFDRTIDAQFDFQPAYTWMLTALLPRWGGSHRAMFEFGKACVATRRFDTCVPFALFQASNRICEEIPDWKAYYRQPEVAPVFMEACRALLDEPSRQPERQFRLSSLAFNAWLVGDHANAADALRQMEGRWHRGMIAKLAQYGTDEVWLGGEIATLAAPFGNDYEQAVHLAEAGDAAAAKTEFTTLATKSEGDVRAFLEARAAVADFEARLASGEWVPVPVSLRQWVRLKGDWQVDDQGAFVVEGNEEPGMILFRGQVRGDFECRGEIEMLTDSGVLPSLQVIGGWPPYSGGRWFGCTVWRDLSKACFAEPRDRIYTLHEESRPIEIEPKNHFLQGVRDGRLTFEWNDRKVFDAYHPAKLDLAKPSGLIGFGTLKFPRGLRTRISHLEVRQVKPAR